MHKGCIQLFLEEAWMIMFDVMCILEYTLPVDLIGIVTVKSWRYVAGCKIDMQSCHKNDAKNGPSPT